MKWDMFILRLGSKILRGIRGEYNFLVDTGASYMVLGMKEFEELKLEPIGRIKFTLADKRVVEAPIAPVKVEAMGREAMVFVALMDSPTPLFGALTLEALGLAVDPSTGEVKASRPVALML